ncbi:MAG: hypothetical protein IPJ77_03695 [Planctomycetes bacterium]|nr:hypothetical protein [Planctomycetota bacterium]
MHGSLALAQGVLYVARPSARTEIVPFDLDGRPLARGFRVRGLAGARVELAALACDVDRRLWAADTGSRALRAFSVFGQELFAWRDDAIEELDRAARIGRPVGVAASGVESELRLLVASAGERRHALHWVDPVERTALSLRPLGDPNERFRRLAGVALSGSFAAACEAGAGRVQVFRDGEFHFAFRCPIAPGTGAAFEPRAVALLADGRFVVACGGERSALLLVRGDGQVERMLAEDGLADGCVFEPSSLAVEPGASDAAARVAVIDRDGARVQLFALDGRSFGAFLDPAEARV